MDGRRHSVDIPISKTLVALKRVRSLRDPSTNSMSKFPTSVDNLNWETNPSNGITLGFINGSKECEIHRSDLMGSKDLYLLGQMEGHVSDRELSNNLRRHKSILNVRECSHSIPNTGRVATKDNQLDGSNLCRTNQEVVCETKLSSARYYLDYGDKDLDLNPIIPSSSCMEGVGSWNEPTEESSRPKKLDHKVVKRKSQCSTQFRSYRVSTGDVMSCTGSPCLSISGATLAVSSHGTSICGSEDVDLLDAQRGCGISCCWSRTPKFRGSNCPSEVEDQPLLGRDVSALTLAGHARGWKHNNHGVTPYSDSPRSFSQKFRPKSFNELIGQNPVSRSLLSVISSDKITPFYVFHGPRGTGKTTASRLFAAALNCLSLEENKPCCLCQECILFFCGRSRDVKEVDAVRINRTDRVKHLVNKAALLPASSRFKVFIIDECHLLRGPTWATVLNDLEDLSGRVVFIMITPHLDKLPRGVVSRSQKYHFPKIKEADIVTKLVKICVAERIDYDQVALDFIAAKSNGSLRDAEMMLEQLSLLGKRITKSLTYELIGIVSDDELLDLLDLALSSDTTNTVRRARELMKSRIDPMQLISQLANLIMDIIAGKYEDGASEVKRRFFERHMSETDAQQLSHALKILSETEKQLRTSKNQTTWLTVALLQLSSVSSFHDANVLSLRAKTLHHKEGDCCSTSSTGESLKHLVTSSFDNNCSCKLGMHDEGTLESIWTRATKICESNSLRNFLQKQGKLSSVCFNRGGAVVELEFHCPDHVSKAEKSWKFIASALQSILGCNVEIRINLGHHASANKYAKIKKLSFSFFSCSRRMHHEWQSSTEHGSLPSENSNLTSEKAMIRDKSFETCSPDCGSQFSHIHSHQNEAGRAIRNSDGNALSIGMTTPHRLPSDSIQKQRILAVDFSKEEEDRNGCQTPLKQHTCFPRTVKLCRKLHSADSSQMPSVSIEPQNKFALSIPNITPSETSFCATNPHIFCSISQKCTRCFRDDLGLAIRSIKHTEGSLQSGFYLVQPFSTS